MINDNLGWDLWKNWMEKAELLINKGDKSWNHGATIRTSTTTPMD